MDKEHSSAFKAAIKAMKAQVQALAVDANLHDQFGATYPKAVSASRERQEYLKAIETLAEELKK